VCFCPEILHSRISRVHTVVVLEGDQTGQELLEEALRVLSSDGRRGSDFALRPFEPTRIGERRRL
jgi:isocitrate/isopropylmalate dehydrogenase